MAPDNQGNDHARILAENPQETLYRAMLECKTAEECRAFMADLCTRQEIAALSERLVIARLLDKGGLSYREISAATGASTTTVGRVARFLTAEPHRGYRLVLDRLKGDHGERNSNSNSDTGGKAD